jgi:hypothetical protein
MGHSLRLPLATVTNNNPTFIALSPECTLLLYTTRVGNLAGLAPAPPA